MRGARMNVRGMASLVFSQQPSAWKDVYKRQADADAETDKRTEVVHALCNSCSSKCG